MNMNNEWLAKVQEDIIEADRPICDPHHHLWDHDLNPYLLPELLADVAQEAAHVLLGDHIHG